MNYIVLLVMLLLMACGGVREGFRDTRQFFSDNVAFREPVNDYISDKRRPTENDYYLKIGAQNIQHEQEKELRRQQVKQQAEQIRIQNQQR